MLQGQSQWNNWIPYIPDSLITVYRSHSWLSSALTERIFEQICISTIGAAPWNPCKLSNVNHLHCHFQFASSVCSLALRLTIFHLVLVNEELCHMESCKLSIQFSFDLLNIESIFLWCRGRFSWTFDTVSSKIWRINFHQTSVEGMVLVRVHRDDRLMRVHRGLGKLMRIQTDLNQEFEWAQGKTWKLWFLKEFFLLCSVLSTY